MPPSPAENAASQESARHMRGALCGLGAYGLWGLIPLYFKAVVLIAPLELLAHRVCWSAIFLIATTIALRKGRNVIRVIVAPRTLLGLLVAAVLLAVNWLTFIYAVESQQVLQSSLGYFLTPLMSVLLGVVVLRERLTRYQTGAIALATVGVAGFGMVVGGLPWIAVTLAVSFSFYGLLRKMLNVDSMAGVLIETVMLIPLAGFYIAYVNLAGSNTADSIEAWGLLALSGPVTAIPLLLFVMAARRLRLATIGFMQFLTPSMHFVLAVGAFGEPLSPATLASFACIWIAVAVYCFDTARQQRKAQRPSSK